MDAVLLARLQFAGTTTVHWLFVVLALGLVPLVAVMHTRAALARDPDVRARWERATRFWGRLYVVNYALGIVTGLVMEFQLGLQWSGLSKYAGNVFGAPLALETLIAFFAESTFLGMWIFGWDRLGRRVHAALLWLVTLTAYASAYWIMVANGFLQHPVGHEVRDGVAYLTDFGAMLVNPSALLALGHITAGSLLAGGLFVAGISAYHLARGRAEFQWTLRMGVAVAGASTVPAYALGGVQYPLLERTQPTKMAVLGSGNWADVGHTVMLYVAYVVFLVALVAVVLVHRKGLLRWRVLSVPLFGLLVGEFVGGLLFGEAGPYRVPIAVVCAGLVGVLLWKPPAYQRFLAPVLVAVIPLPFVASVGGWLFREGGRQPWLVYGELTVADAVSPVSATATAVSLVVFMSLFVALAVADWVLIARFARRVH